MRDRVVRILLAAGLLVTLYAAAWLWPTLPDTPPIQGLHGAPEPLWPAFMDPELAWLEMDADILARVALEEDPSAAASVMWVVINRARERPSPVLLETVATPGAFHGLRERTPLRTPWDRRQWDRLQAIAWDVLLGLQADPTGGATHFHRTGTWTPPWAPQEAQWVSRGAHVFYRGA